MTQPYATSWLKPCPKIVTATPPVAGPTMAILVTWFKPRSLEHPLSLRRTPKPFQCDSGLQSRVFAHTELRKKQILDSHGHAACRGPGHGHTCHLIQGAGFRVQGAGFRVQGLGFRVQGSGFRVQGLGCRVRGSRFGVTCKVQGYLTLCVN